MKNKKILLVSIIAAAVVVIATAVILLVSFTGINAAVRKVNKSMQSVAGIVTTVTVTDGEMAVYGYERTVQIEGENSLVTVCESKLNSSFVLERQAEIQSQQKTDRKKLFGIGLKNRFLNGASFKGDKFTATISALDFPKVFEGATASSDAVLEITFAGGKIEQLSCSYTSSAGHLVTLIVTYSY